tara:strand:- start:1614 stop:2633 length:1020 start_codon:yes stop_codon:yes gene_type:complete
MIEIFFLILSIFLTNILFKKKKILPNATGQLHQIYNQDQHVPLSGGLFIIGFFYLNYDHFGLTLILYFTIFFLFGLFTDLNLIKSPSYRFLTQILLLIIFITHLEIQVYDVRIISINNLLENYYFNIFFVLFCFLVLINGSNFIDGNNGISIGYFLIIFILILNLINKDYIFFDETFLNSLIIILIILLFFNLFNQLYLGDSGVYLLSLFSGYILIDIFSQNQEISPYFIANVFWYPAFEILFSLIRKIKSNYSPLKPDTLHFHQILFNFYLKNINLSKTILNSITGLSINIYNGIILYFASLNISNTKLQLMVLFISLIFYLTAYFILLRYKNLSKKV